MLGTWTGHKRPCLPVALSSLPGNTPSPVNFDMFHAWCASLFPAGLHARFQTVTRHELLFWEGSRLMRLSICACSGRGAPVGVPVAVGGAAAAAYLQP
ncbi:Uncharacterized protein HZ326_0452 [Fusarium oxysporum f. sp. albedinis]|nr:Uncharacterized protein HZ326_0452 [Fusarium oxysporum f. sp. albedinis]